MAVFPTQPFPRRCIAIDFPKPFLKLKEVSQLSFSRKVPLQKDIFLANSQKTNKFPPQFLLESARVISPRPHPYG